MDEKSRQIVRDFFTEVEWDIIQEALDDYQVDEVDGDTVDSAFKKLTSLWSDPTWEERRKWNAVQP
jgi:hypothetical protein